ncbi:MAG: polysaccharide deacetylase family protein [Polaromonas sp.]|uniref:polysaccharide deacetylase family protein n=1 Tax=Polaromonas sp. TaxID=1869339 RepID=UPI002734009B|nr:polysaccharide deacetylase family protein [Polaromonas sp.]MDP2818551.1 polysaccharide deacetylase family protein [Polaromonas sp.]
MFFDAVSESRRGIVRFSEAIFLCTISLTLSACLNQVKTDASAVPHAFSPSASPDPGVLLLLVANDQVLTAPEITAWVDAAAEEGVRIQAITDKQFIALAASGNAQAYAGVLLPDQSHRFADHEVVWAIRKYTVAGGRTLLVFDFAALEPGAFNRQLYAENRSRLSDLAGVEYILYDELLDRTTATGPVVASPATLRDLLVPPGKSIFYASPQAAAKTAAAKDGQPGGSRDEVASELHAYSGYMRGNLTYPSFVTRGEFRGTVLARSPQHGLVAGVHSLGKGKVLFVNLPLTYLKLQTDALPLHGYLRYFIDHVVSMARLSPMPNGIAGMTLNWHLDSMAAQKPSLELERLGVFNDGPFSIDITAGPDTIEFDDELGWNLDNNPVAQALLRRLDKQGHSIGSHGGWIHDHYGLNANETNAEEFLPFLELNKASVEKVLGRPQRSYSAPQGNNPIWAMNWLEQQGVVGAYMTGHTGMGPTRHYRDGKLHNPGMWIFPVTPLGRHAVFEEFAYHDVPQREIVAWYRDMVDFAIKKNTSRLIYMHPPWAFEWKGVVLDLLAYAKDKGVEQFRWYTTERLADFMTQRRDVQWTERLDASGVRHFNVSHPVTLREMVWILPKTSYPLPPEIVTGTARVTAEGPHWRVKAGDGTALEFTAMQPR